MRECSGCGLPHKQFGAFLMVPDELFKKINNGSTKGLLCANCICQRIGQESGLLCYRMNEVVISDDWVTVTVSKTKRTK